ncbi:hypothetical protein [uncultured Boseongicola sp.]|uniref:hypothetical protein n=1 Tax=uncultured Boseongicola sp. TaxID=1648499 RepID=UPI002627D708|nr:hypothetical protein [uncultured Boseongicola sp.]
MSKLEEIADGLAKRALDLVEKTGDETIERRTADEIGALSPTLQEAYTTAVRIRKAEHRASQLLNKYDAGEHIPKAAISSQPQD